MTGIARKQVKWWAVVFLPILLRALIPVGVMPMVGPDFTVRLVVCDGDPVSSTASTAMPMDMPVGMVMAGDDTSASPAHHVGHDDRGSCPYGSAPALGALPSLACLPTQLIQRSAESSLAAAQLAYVKVSPRAQSPRGPPV